MSFLESIQSPNDLKKLSIKQLEDLAEELRTEILHTVSENGGHLASNLGMVEATLALHYVFNAPNDHILFDVSHQSYAHKLITGRYQTFSTLRQSGGISGFFNPAESIYDPLFEGHSGTAISQALAFATADALDTKPNYSIAIVGDGAFTNGMSYEALNNCAEKDLRLVILLNDNEMSISKNIGGLNGILRQLRSSAGYFRFKHNTKKIFGKIPLLGRAILWLGRAIKNFFKRVMLTNNIFENLGLKYIGPVDGNNLKKTISALKEAKDTKGCCVVHLYTKKGLGYSPAVAEPTKYHAVEPFDPAEGICVAKVETFSSHFGEFLNRRADEDERICAITAAMGAGCGLLPFAHDHPSRFFDVGIAEEHAVTFGAALSAAGKLPVCAIYSTFAQRVFDQLFQDVTLGNLHLVLALDRCGFVEGDGCTHQGIYDVALFSSLPAVIYSPATFGELDFCLDAALHGKGLQIVRYPKGEEQSAFGWEYSEDKTVAYTPDVQRKKTVIVTYGRAAWRALPCAGDVGIIRLIKIFPLDKERLEMMLAGAEVIFFLEEGIYEGGLAQKFCALFADSGKRILTRNARGPVAPGKLPEIYAMQGFSSEQIAAVFHDARKN